VKEVQLVNLDMLGKKIVRSGNFSIVQGHLLQIGETKVAIADRSYTLPNDAGGIKVDILILRNNPGASISELLERYHPECVVIDGSNSRRNALRWMMKCKKLGIRATDLRTDGALVADV
jgi:hypothetical protein